MKNFILILLTLTAFLLLFPMIITAQNEITDDIVIVWTEPWFEEIARSLLAKPTGDITVGEFGSIGAININLYGNGEINYNVQDLIFGHTKSELPITSIHDLRYFTNLISLSCTGITLTNPNEFSELKNLEILTIYDNNDAANYIEPLSKLEYLIEFQVQNLKITELPGYENLKWLQNINLSSYEELAVVHTFKNMPDLTRIGISFSDVEDTEISQLDFSGFSELDKISTLHIALDNPQAIIAFQNSDLTPFSKMPELTVMYVEDNSYTDFPYDTSHLSALTNLTSLYIVKANISDISFIQKLKDLSSFIAILSYKSNITDVSALLSLEKLEVICINPLNEDVDLRNFVRLHTLVLDGTEISYTSDIEY